MLVEGVEFGVHRCVMAARSSVFAAMLSDDCKENHTGIIQARAPTHPRVRTEMRIKFDSPQVAECTSRGFDCFLRFLYSGRCQREEMPAHADELLFLSDKYAVGSLKAACDIYLASRPLEVHDPQVP